MQVEPKSFLLVYEARNVQQCPKSMGRVRKQYHSQRILEEELIYFYQSIVKPRMNAARSKLLWITEVRVFRERLRTEPYLKIDPSIRLERGTKQRA
jgi:hypothetical protein